MREKVCKQCLKLKPITQYRKLAYQSVKDIVCKECYSGIEKERKMLLIKRADPNCYLNSETSELLEKKKCIRRAK